MRTNRLLYHETISHLYHRPTYAFTLHNLNYLSSNETDDNMAFLAPRPDNPVRHIRRILIEADFPRPIVDNNDYRDMALLFEHSLKPAFCKCDVRIVDAIAPTATNLERLEITYSRRGDGSKRHITGKYMYPSLGLDRVVVKSYSWMDAPKPEVPDKLEGFGIGDDEWPRVEHRTMVEEIKRAMRESVEGGEEVADAVERVMDEESGIISSIWHALRGVEREKAFFAGTVLGLVERLKGTLREVVVFGTVDRDWMQKVMELGVTVRAHDMNEEDGEWVIFGTSGSEEEKHVQC